MPIYEIKCDGCSLQCEVHAPMSQTQFACVVCGCECHKVPSTFSSERRFAGSESVSFRYRMLPKEVKEKRKWLGESGNCVQDDGRVVFSTRGEEKKFNDSWEKNVAVRPKSEILAKRNRAILRQSAG